MTAPRGWSDCPKCGGAGGKTWIAPRRWIPCSTCEAHWRGVEEAIAAYDCALEHVRQKAERAEAVLLDTGINTPSRAHGEET